MFAEPLKNCTAEQATATLLVLEPGAFIAAEDYRRLAVALQVRTPGRRAPVSTGHPNECKACV